MFTVIKSDKDDGTPRKRGRRSVGRSEMFDGSVRFNFVIVSA